MKTTSAAVLYGVGDLRIEPRRIHDLEPHEALVRISVCGVCGSDAIEAGRSRVLAVPPVTLGHEFTGTIEAVGRDVTDLQVGATVVSGAGIACGMCTFCEKGRSNLCTSYHTIGFHRDGALAGYVVAPATTLYDVSDSELSSDTLALAQPMAIAVHAVRRSGLQPGSTAVVVGVGGIGAFITYVAAMSGAQVIAVARSPEKLQLARGLGAAHGIVSDQQSLSEHLARLGVMPNVLFETSGSAQGISSVLSAATRGSTIVPVGIQREPVLVDLGSLSLQEMRLIGTVAHVYAQDVPEAVRLLAARSDWSDIARVVYPLSQLLEHALMPLLEGRATQIKSLIDPWSEHARAAIHGMVPK